MDAVAFVTFNALYTHTRTRLIKSVSKDNAIQKMELEMNTEMVVGGKKIQLGLDRTVIGLPYPKLPTVDKLNPVPDEQVVLAYAQQKDFVAKLKHIESVITTGPYKCSIAKNKDLKRYYVQSELGDAQLCIFTLGFSFGTAVINLELNPSKLTADDYAEILGLLEVMFSHDYHELYDRGVVSHAEFYVDVSEEDLSNLTLVDEGRRRATNYKGTSYHGVRTSRLVTTMYDKAKQSKEDGQRVRIEARLNRRDIRFKDLVEQDLFNPLSSLLPVEICQLQLVAQKWKLPHLANSIKELGLYGAIANKQARKAILAYLREHTVPWWQPDVFWAAHRELLIKLKPGQAGVFAIGPHPQSNQLNGFGKGQSPAMGVMQCEEMFS